MHSVRVTFRLSKAAQKASIIAGGDGKAVQHTLVPSDSPHFMTFVHQAEVSPDGSMTIDLGREGADPIFESFPTLEQLMEVIGSRQAELSEPTAEAEEDSKKLAKLTREVVRKQKTMTATVQDGSIHYDRVEPAWPEAGPDPKVLRAPKTVKWIKELEHENERRLRHAKAARGEAASGGPAEQVPTEVEDGQPRDEVSEPEGPFGGPPASEAPVLAAWMRKVELFVKEERQWRDQYEQKQERTVDHAVEDEADDKVIAAIVAAIVAEAQDAHAIVTVVAGMYAAPFHFLPMPPETHRDSRKLAKYFASRAGVKAKVIRPVLDWLESARLLTWIWLPDLPSGRSTGILLDHTV